MINSRHHQDGLLINRDKRKGTAPPSLAFVSLGSFKTTINFPLHMTHRQECVTRSLAHVDELALAPFPDAQHGCLLLGF